MDSVNDFRTEVDVQSLEIFSPVLSSNYYSLTRYVLLIIQPTATQTEYLPKIVVDSRLLPDMTRTASQPHARESLGADLSTTGYELIFE